MIEALLNAKWLAYFTSFNKLVVGFSGGLDSTVLLHALASHPSSRTKLIAVHINHAISVNAEVWQTHCEQFCQNLGIDFFSKTVEFDRSANLEERARSARYRVFSSLIAKQDCLVLGHHQDDQAETVLLQLFRGAGIDGLAAMSETSSFALGSLARPFLNHSRTQLEQYAALQQLTWVEDESNQEIHYSRNYLRQQIIPILAQKWPGVVGNLARTAVHCQHARNNLNVLAIKDCGDLLSAKNTLSLEPLRGLNFERVINVLRAWLKKNKATLPTTITLHRVICEMIEARKDSAPEVSWGEFVIRRYQQHLYLNKKIYYSFSCPVEWTEFPAPLILEEAGLHLLAQKANQGFFIPQNATLKVQFRKGGEEFFIHGQTKKLKKLFQAWSIPSWEREQIPLLYINNELAVIVGHAISDLFFTENADIAWVLIH